MHTECPACKAKNSLTHSTREIEVHDLDYSTTGVPSLVVCCHSCHMMMLLNPITFPGPVAANLFVRLDDGERLV